MLKESSERLSVIRFPLIVGVVFIHSYSSTVTFAANTVGLSESNLFVDFVRDLLSQGVARVAVPLFFLMSGYLFFFGFIFSKKTYSEKIKSRVESLLIPFLFWNLVTLFVVAVAQATPETRQYFSGGSSRIANFGCWEYIKAVFGIDRTPISYQFWFIRDLIILVLASPIIYLIIWKVSWIFISVLFLCWFLGLSLWHVPSIEALFFFALGASLAHKNRDLFFLDEYGRVISFAYVLVVVLDTLSKGTEISPYLHRLGVFFGVVSMLFLTKFVIRSELIKKRLLLLSSASFFVYAAHEPLLTIVRKVIYKLIQPESPYLILALYFIIPTLVIMFLIPVYRFLLLVLPKFTRVITGGR